MKRSMMQVYTSGSVEAVALYLRAFDAVLRAGYRNPDGTYAHAELDVQGQIVAVAEDPNLKSGAVRGNTMQFCFHYGPGGESAVLKAFDALSEGGTADAAPAPVEWSPLMCDVTDKFGVRWCLFV